MKNKIIEYNKALKNKLCDLINKLYTEDPEGEPISQEKIDATVKQAEEYPDRLKIFMIVDADKDTSNAGDEAVIGYSIIQLIWSNEWGGLTANIDEMYIVQRARSQGVASKFIDELPELIPEINRMTIEVTPSNDKAFELYERLGFGAAENRVLEKILQ